MIKFRKTCQNRWQTFKKLNFDKILAAFDRPGTISVDERENFSELRYGFRGQTLFSNKYFIKNSKILILRKSLFNRSNVAYMDKILIKNKNTWSAWRSRPLEFSPHEVVRQISAPWQPWTRPWLLTSFVLRFNAIFVLVTTVPALLCVGIGII